ncbi:MAG: arylsulfatase A-like enzyme [Verrucomicrobiales bacterium]|jgi:arylsulfatase A-like enzyme
MIRSFLVLFTALVLLPAVHGKPNVIVIMGDDMGYSDLGCYGSEIDTPNLDQLAAGGVRFTQFYNTARCCPTRAALLTGLYSHQAGIGWMMSDNGHAGYRGELNNRSVTIAEALKPAGYRTYMSGKWHVTKRIDPKGPNDNWPRQRGFDRFYGTIHGAGSFFDPNTLTRDNTMISPYADPEYTPEQYYYTDAISDHAVRFIKEHARDHKEEPFFLYASYTAAHWPMHALERDIAKYKGAYDEGYAAIRKKRFEKMKSLGVIAAGAELSPSPEAWEDMPFKEWDIRNMEVYAAMVDSMDQGIGRIVQSLKDTGNFEDTLILFLQDNGGCAEAYGRLQNKWKSGDFPKRGDEPTLPPLADDYLQEHMQPRQTRDGWPVLTGPGVMPGPADTYIGYGRGWATVSNTPFREYKHWEHEGGISSPLIAHWPAKITRKGELEHEAGHLIDLMATCMDVSEGAYPKEHRGEQIQPMEGLSLVPAFMGGKLERDALYWEHEGNRAIRMGKWKLVAKGAQGAWELYDIEKDRSELHDLAAAEPELAQAMAAKWHMWALRANVFPLTPYYKNRPKKKG